MKKLLCSLLIICSMVLFSACATPYKEEQYKIYELAQEAGFTGTYEQWLATIKGADGKDGREIELAVVNNKIVWKYQNETLWRQIYSIDDLIGPKGEDGKTPDIKIGANGNWFINGVDTNIKSKGEDGKSTITSIGNNGNWFIDGKDTNIKAKGENGRDGKSAYEIYKDYHPEYTKSEKEWLDDLVNGRLGNTLEKELTVKFDSKGGNEIKDQKIKKGSLIKDIPTPTKKDHTFLGWYYCDIEWIFPIYPVSEDITLEAKWSHNDLIVTIDNQNGDNTYKEQVEYNSYLNITMPKKNGFIFVEWQDEKGNTINFPYRVTESIKIHAVWRSLYGEGDLKLGFGVEFRSDSSINATADKNGTLQIDGTIATIVTDKLGKIVECRLDGVQNKISVSNKGEMTIPDSYKTKRELGYDYHMHDWGADFDNNYDGVVKEWFEQANAFEEWAKGKTRKDIETMGTKESNGHIISSDDTLLSAGCTIEIIDFRSAILKAFDDDQAYKFKIDINKEFKIGLKAETFNDMKNRNAVAGSEGFEAMDGESHLIHDFQALVVQNNKVIASITDELFTMISFDATGAKTGDRIQKTKRELKFDNGMSQFHIDNDGNGITKEWFEQVNAFSNYLIGMNGEQIKNIKTQERNGHMIAADQALLDCGCSIQITDHITTAYKAFNNAR